jgi:hypothetical protein
MIEVAGLGRPACFGPHTNNFAEAVELLLGVGGAAVIHNARELTAVLRAWLSNPAAARAMGERARDAIRKQQGSTDRYVHALLARLPRPPGDGAKHAPAPLPKQQANREKPEAKPADDQQNRNFAHATPCVNGLQADRPNRQVR